MLPPQRRVLFSGLWRWAARARNYIGSLTLAIAFAGNIGVVLVSPPAALASGTVSAAVTNPSCYLSGGCGGGASVIDYVDANAAAPDQAVGGFGSDLVSLGLDTEAVPEPWWVPGLSSIALGAAAFDVGLKIGTTADHFWYEFQADEVAAAGCTNESYIFAYPPSGYTGPTVGGSGTQTYFMRANCGGPVVLTGTPAHYNGSGAYNAYYSMTQGLVKGAEYAVNANDCGSNAPSCYVYAVDPTTMFTGEGITSSQPSGANHTATVGFANPSTGAGLTTTAPGFGTGSFNPQCVQGGVTMSCGSVDPNGGAVTPANGLPSTWGEDGFAVANANWMNCQLQPNIFACPGLSADGGGGWSSTGGPLITIPNCYTQAVTDCETAFDDALAAAGSVVTPAFTTTIAPTYDPNVPVGAVVATIPAEGTIADASTVVLEVNEEEQPTQYCSATAENYHLSEHTGVMLAVLYVQYCNFTSPPNVYLRAVAWACTSKPDSNYADLSAGDFGCVPDAATPGDQTVTANGYLPGTKAFLNGPAYDPTKWYIAYVYSVCDAPFVEPGFSQAVPPGTYGQ